MCRGERYIQYIYWQEHTSCQQTGPCMHACMYLFCQLIRSQFGVKDGTQLFYQLIRPWFGEKDMQRPTTGSVGSALQLGWIWLEDDRIRRQCARICPDPGSGDLRKAARGGGARRQGIHTDVGYLSKIQYLLVKSRCLRQQPSPLGWDKIIYYFQKVDLHYQQFFRHARCPRHYACHISFQFQTPNQSTKNN